MIDSRYSQDIQHRIDQKTKPLGALGQLESVAHQLALIQSQGLPSAVDQIEVKQPNIVIFAGDHGIADEGVSIAPSAVTQQMVLNFLNGGAAINCFCDVNNIALTVVDTGILLEVETTSPQFVSQRLGTRTNNFAAQAAMILPQVEEGISLGKKVVAEQIEKGSNLVMFGEMGIGNTSSSAAILSALAGKSVEDCVGLGTGITSEQLQLKTKLIGEGVKRCNGKPVKEVLAEVGGFEIVQMVGGFLAAHEHKTPVIVDGFIVSVAAYVATLIQPEARDYMIFAHKSEESGHKIVLDLLDAKPLLDLGLRLGEGTGAALALPLIMASVQFYNHMASFESAGVTV
ncbi:nicotinate-nucleotide--dimethylbenzimidazole phosphoribosyltransferase [Vibrio profundi]|uniref:nicotinate-nucleotide--dimethylbenzimidazole phosphoribosyltransferase n=1 Tax=Vibrio profundi TaxID=1774960 RepID=UPI003735EF4B